MSDNNKYIKWIIDSDIDYYIYEKYLNAVKYNLLHIEDIPKKYLTHDICVAFIKYGKYSQHRFLGSSGYSLYGNNPYDIPDEFLTYDIWLEIVKNGCGDRFIDIPDKFKTYEMCLNYVECNNYGISYVPNEHLTYELCKTAILTNPNIIGHNSIPKKYLTYDIYLYCVKYSGILLKSVPDKYKSYEMCLAAIGLHNIEYPKKLKYWQKRLWGLQQGLPDYLASYKIIEHVPTKFLTYELCSLAMKNYGYSPSDHHKNICGRNKQVKKIIFNTYVYK